MNDEKPPSYAQVIQDGFGLPETREPVRPPRRARPFMSPSDTGDSPHSVLLDIADDDPDEQLETSLYSCCWERCILPTLILIVGFLFFLLIAYVVGAV